MISQIASVGTEIVHFSFLVIRYCHETLLNTLQVFELMIKSIKANLKRDLLCKIQYI